MNQLSIILDRVESKRRKREGMERASAKNSAWMRERLFDLTEYALTCRRFPMEFFRAWCVLNRRPEPSSSNCWGSFAAFAVAAGVIKPTDEWVKAASKRTHAHRVMIYESLVEREPVPGFGYV